MNCMLMFTFIFVQCSQYSNKNCQLSSILDIHHSHKQHLCECVWPHILRRLHCGPVLIITAVNQQCRAVNSAYLSTKNTFTTMLQIIKQVQHWLVLVFNMQVFAVYSSTHFSNVWGVSDELQTNTFPDHLVVLIHTRLVKLPVITY